MTDVAPEHAVEHRHVIMSNESSAEATIELAVFSTKAATLRVFDEATEPRAELATVMAREQAVAGVNGGYFDPDYAPVGLLVIDGKTISPFRKARLLSGIMVAGKGGVQLLRAAEFSPKRSVTTAVQCGPFLVDRAQPVPGLNDTRGARRTFVATSGGERAAIGFCSGATLAELAQMLSANGVLGEAKILRAMNLDGGSSSGFWFNGGSVSIAERKTVRNFVGLVGK